LNTALVDQFEEFDESFNLVTLDLQVKDGLISG